MVTDVLFRKIAPEDVVAYGRTFWRHPIQLHQLVSADLLNIPSGLFHGRDDGTREMYR